MIWVLAALAALALLAALVWAAGRSLPPAHVATRSVWLATPPEMVWVTVATPALFPSWRSDVTAVETLDRSAGGHARWREVGRHGRIAYELRAASPPGAARPGQLITRIADPALPFGGEWEVTVASTTGGTVVTVVERGEVKSPLFRLVSRFVVGQATTIERYLRDLGRHFGETVTPTAATPRVAPRGGVAPVRAESLDPELFRGA